MKEIKSEELKQLTLDIMRFVDTFCRENDIKYYIAFGTLIGAIRHKGMIPWDDDIDIVMPRKEYNRFIRLMQEQKGKTIYQVNCYETDPDFYLPWARICNNKTILLNRPHRKENDLGVWIDVFPLDNASTAAEMDSWFEEYQRRRAKVWHTIPTPYEKFSFKKQVFTTSALLRAYYGVGNFKKYRDEFVAWAIRYNDKESNEYMVPGTMYKMRLVFPKALFNDTVEVDFEGLKLIAPAEYDKFLRIVYGDYMQLPPVEKRITHHHFTAYYK